MTSLLVSALLHVVVGQTPGFTAQSATIVLKVTHRDQAAEALMQSAERLGGYFATRTDEQLVLKVPAHNFTSLLAELEPLGVVAERQLAAEDLRLQLAEQRARLHSRDEVFQRYFDVMNSADPGAVVEVESAMIRLVGEMEQLAGAIRLLEHRTAMAQVTVVFQFRDRRPPTRDGNSSFAWLNTVNLADLMQEFAHGQ